MKNKFILAVIFSGMIFLAGSFSAKAGTGTLVSGYACGEGEKGVCEEGSFTCSLGGSHYTLSNGEDDCADGFRCCKFDKKLSIGDSCGDGDKGKCMEVSMFTCPDGYSFVEGGSSNCEGSSVRCCGASTKTASDDTKTGGAVDKSGGTTKTGGAVDKSGTGNTAGKVQPLGKIDIPENLGLPNNTIKGVLTNVLTWLLGIIGVLALMGFIISGIQYLLAYSSEDLAETAKKNMTFSVVGITIALAGFIIIQAINLALQGTPWF